MRPKRLATESSTLREEMGERRFQSTSRKPSLSDTMGASRAFRLERVTATLAPAAR